MSDALIVVYIIVGYVLGGCVAHAYFKSVDMYYDVDVYAQDCAKLLFWIVTLPCDVIHRVSLKIFSKIL